MSDAEIWKPLPGYGNHYLVSNFGRIQSRDREVKKACTGIGRGVCVQKYKGRLLKPFMTSKYGHMSVHIGVDGEKHVLAMHRAVLLAFVGPAPEGMEACHNNGDASDNCLDNLRWDTHLANNRDRIKHGTYPIGDKHPMAKFSAAVAAEIRTKAMHYTEYAAKFGMSKTQAHRIYSGRGRTTA